jgi:cysteinyl-tRNA synthetase
VLFELLTSLNRFAEKKHLEGTGKDEEAARALFQRGAAVLRELSQLLGLFYDTPQQEQTGDRRLLDGLMQLLLDLRAEARKAKNFAVADQIRKRLADLNVTLEDRPGGTGWRVG